MLINASGRTMEDLFFYEKELSLLEARKELEQLKETKANLARVSGIQSDAMLEKLIALDIRPETLATLFAIPLVEVAWADGELQEKERDELFKYAERAGKRNTKINPKIITAWLKQKPDPALMVAWVHYIQTLSRELSQEERQTLKDEVMTDARAIAQAAGGFLGLGRLSEEERKVLAQLEAAFG